MPYMKRTRHDEQPTDAVYRIYDSGLEQWYCYRTPYGPTWTRHLHLARKFNRRGDAVLAINYKPSNFEVSEDGRYQIVEFLLLEGEVVDSFDIQQYSWEKEEGGTRW